MSDNRKQIIIKEIQYWKTNRMLPAQYCDYLLALYTEGDTPEEKEPKKRKSKGKVSWFFLLLIPLVLFIFYFTELSFILQTALVLILSVFGMWVTFQLFKKGMHFQVPLVVSALIILFATVEISDRIFNENLFGLFSLLICNCILWLFSGKKLKLLYFTISGWMGLVLIFVAFIFSIS